MIENYTERQRKLSEQAKVYSKIKSKTFVGLCGPNVIEYLNKIDYKKFKRITLYEIDIIVYKQIIQKLGKNYPTVTIYNESINKHLGRIKAFYDLDYCRTLGSVREYLPKIVKIEEFSITMSRRNFKGDEIKIFRSYLGHDAFVHYPYRDGGPMLMFHVSKRLWG